MTFVLAAIVFHFSGRAAWAIDKTIAVDMGSPVEISLPPDDSLSQWIIREMPKKLLEEVSLRRLPNETVFLFRPLAEGIGVVQFAKKAVGGGMMSQTVTYDVEVMVTGGKQAAVPPSAPGRPIKSSTGEENGNPPASNGSRDYTPADQLIHQMLEGNLGFPAKNLQPKGPSDTEEAMRRKNPLPFSLSYVFPPGSFLLNPTHRLPLPDTPPGMDTPPAPYHQALELAKRGFYKQAAEVMDDLIKEYQKKKPRNIPLENFFEFMNGHVLLSNGDYEEAIKKFKTLIPTRELGVASRFYAALALEYKGDTLGAISGYQGVISHNPEGVFSSEAAWRICRIFYRAKAYDRAIYEYSNFLGHNSGSPYIDDAIMDLAHLYDQVYRYQDIDLSVKLFDNLIQNYPESPYYDSAVARKKYIQENYF